MTAALGDIIAGLEAADVLSPLSPVPARLAALCASLRIGGHGIAAPPADDLPERWLSLLAHYQRRKPDTASVRDGYAAVAAALPELDGVRLALLGLHNTEGTSSLHVLARGMTAERHSGLLGVDLAFPLSVWLRDSGGRWHAARPVGWHRAAGAGRCGWPARRSRRRPGRRPGACRTRRTGSERRGAGTTCCRCWRWGTDSRSG